MKPLTIELLRLTEKPYDEYNAILPIIKGKLQETNLVGAKRVLAFEEILSLELPFTTARRAYRTAIKIALGEDSVDGETIEVVRGVLGRKSINLKTR